MSKIGNSPIPLDQTKVTLDGQKVLVSGPKGSQTIEIPKVLSASVEENKLIVKRNAETKTVKAMHGLFRSLIANAVHGVAKGWEKKLEVVGTGFGVSVKGGEAVFKVGFSHQVVFPKIEGLTYVADSVTMLTISGVDKQLVGEAAHRVRSIRPPDAYKGKGIRYLGEVVKLKPGKKVKTA